MLVYAKNLRYLLIIFIFMCFIWALVKPLIDEFQQVPIVITVPVKQQPVITKPVERFTERSTLQHVTLPDFSLIYDIKEKKRQFFDFLKPIISQENTRLLNLRKQMLFLLEKISFEQPLTPSEQLQIQGLAKHYRLNNSDDQFQTVLELIKRIDIIPSPLILVQAANESAWGTSRFATTGLNLFGIWCFQKGCGMVPNARNEDATHEVATFKSVSEAVRHYLHNINTNSAYELLRNIRFNLREQNKPLSPQMLATGLLPYSERGSAYVIEINQMLRHNQAYFQPEVVE